MTRTIALLACLLALAACGSAPPPRPEPVDIGERLMTHGVQTFRAGRYLEAQRSFQRAVTHYRSLDRARETAAALISASEILLLYGDTQNAESFIEQAASEALRANYGELMMRAQLLRARRLDISGKPDAASVLAAEIARDSRSASPRLVEQARLLQCKLAVANGNNGCIDTLTAGEPLTQARLERLRAQAAIGADDLLAADVHFEKALAIYRQQFYRPGIAASYEEKAAAAIARLHELDGAAAETERDHARQYLERALFIRLWMQDRVHVIETLDLLQRAAASAEEAAHWSGWRNYLLQDSEPDWQKLERSLRLRSSN